MYNDVIQTIALSMGLAWASGINLYAAIFMLGFMSGTGSIDLPPDLEVLQNPIVVASAGVMYLVEFMTDKIPGVDSGWDALHTFIRIPAGAILAATALGDATPALQVAAGILGGGMATVSHAAKSGTRLMINTTPEPFSNWGASVTEDVAVITGLWVALYNPWLFLILMVAWVFFMVWLLPKVWRGVKQVFRFLAKLFGQPIEDPLPKGINMRSGPISTPPSQLGSKND